MNRLFLIVAFTVMFQLVSVSQTKLAFIKDKEGYTYIQSAKGTEFDIVCEIKSNDLFYCEKATGDYYPVVATQRDKSEKNYSSQVKGYLHKSHVQIVEEMPIGGQKKILTHVLEEYKIYATEYNRIYSSARKNGNHFVSKADSIKADEWTAMNSNFYDEKFEAILVYFPGYYCKTRDIELLDLLFSTMWANMNSADEMPSETICDSYLCNEQLFLNELWKIKNQEELDYLVNQIGWGVLRHFKIEPETENITNKECQRLINQLKIKVQ